MTSHLELTRDHGVATITLKSGKVNALCGALLDELRAAAVSFSTEGNIPGAVVITGGPKLFAAGADIAEFAADTSVENFSIADHATTSELGNKFLEALNAVAAIPVPTIASISGFALGGGCELALATDLRIGSTRATLGQPEILLGIIPGGGGTQRLARLVGPSVAKDLIFTGRMVRAEEAHRIGLLNEVVDPDDLDEHVSKLARSFAQGASHALALCKSAIDEGLETTLHEGLLLEQQKFVSSFETPDAPVGVSSFLQHGPGKADFGTSA